MFSYPSSDRPIPPLHLSSETWSTWTSHAWIFLNWSFYSFAVFRKYVHFTCLNSPNLIVLSLVFLRLQRVRELHMFEYPSSDRPIPLHPSSECTWTSYVTSSSDYPIPSPSSESTWTSHPSSDRPIPPLNPSIDKKRISSKWTYRDWIHPIWSSYSISVSRKYVKSTCLNTSPQPIALSLLFIRYQRVRELHMFEYPSSDHPIPSLHSSTGSTWSSCVWIPPIWSTYPSSSSVFRKYVNFTCLNILVWSSSPSSSSVFSQYVWTSRVWKPLIWSSYPSFHPSIDKQRIWCKWTQRVWIHPIWSSYSISVSRKYVKFTCRSLCPSSYPSSASTWTSHVWIPSSDHSIPSLHSSSEST